MCACGHIGVGFGVAGSESKAIPEPRIAEQQQCSPAFFMQMPYVCIESEHYLVGDCFFVVYHDLKEPTRTNACIAHSTKKHYLCTAKTNIRKHINELLMYNEQIEALISAALTDGKLTEKEKQVLMKRAKAQGIDLDEFKMVLSARLFELV